MTENKFLPKGAATWSIGYEGAPKEYVFVLLENLTMLALSSALEPLRIANQIARKELYHWHTMSVEGRQITCSNGQRLLPDTGLRAIARQATGIVVSGTQPAENLDAAVTQWVRQQNRIGSRLGGICTGAFTLALAGVLKGKSFTLHWENQASFVETFDELSPSKNLFEIDGAVLTAAGGSAATDLMLHIIEEDFGNTFALVVADMCLHGRSQSPQREQRTSHSALLENRNDSLVAAVKLMETHVEDTITLDDIADAVSSSRRQLERTFRTYLGASPGTYYTHLRTARAYALLAETNMSVAQVAVATGFSSTANLSKHFRQKYEISPSHFKKTWAGSSVQQSKEAAR